MGPEHRDPDPVGWAAAVLVDAAGILVFVGIGRHTHDHGVTLAGMTSTAWPFLAGAALGWLGCRGWRAPGRLVPTGVAVWLSCVAVGMVLRVVSGQGTAPAFVVVALGFLGLELLGWRLVCARVLHRRARRRPT